MNKGVWILWTAALAASLLAVPFLAACSSSEGNKVAGGTEAESTLAFHVQRSDGSVAPYARVRVLPENYLSDGSALAQWKESDVNGFVEMSVEPGDYTLEVRHVDGASATGAVRQVAFGGKESGSKVDTVKLGALSSIEGYVLLGDSTAMYCPTVRAISSSTRFRREVSMSSSAIRKSHARRPSRLLPAIRCTWTVPIRVSMLSSRRNPPPASILGRIGVLTKRCLRKSRDMRSGRSELRALPTALAISPGPKAKSVS